MGQILTKKISPQNEPHTTKLRFSVVLKRFGGNSLKNSLFSQKRDISERSSEILRKLIFLDKFKKGKFRRKFGFVLNNYFCSKL